MTGLSVHGAVQSGSLRNRLVKIYSNTCKTSLKQNLGINGNLFLAENVYRSEDPNFKYLY